MSHGDLRIDELGSDGARLLRWGRRSLWRSFAMRSTHHLFARRCSTLALMFSGLVVHAHEGMWLPTLLKSIEGDLMTAGLRITAEDVYSVNHGSIKDAIVLFGGGCTAEVISGEGLILTNHHCGFSAIQEHSSLEH